MLSIELLRKDPEMVRAAMARRHEDVPIDDILQKDRVHREKLVEAEALRARRNDVSKQISRTNPKPRDVIAEMREVGDRIKALEAEIAALEAQVDQARLRLPNIPHANVPEGPDASGNVTVRACGQRKSFDFKPQPHWDIGPKLGILDFETGQKISGSRFFVLRGAGAKLQRALIQWMLDFHSREHGYLEVAPPYMVREQVLYGAGQLPKFAENLYHDAEEDYWFVPTAEVPITGFHSGQILAPSAVPLSYVAYTACFRREKMSAGRDIRGMKRLHQFDKVELYKIVEPQRSDEALKTLLKDAESVAQALDIPYRIIQLCAGDLGFAATESYDIEMWAPGCDEWLEVSSVSNCGDFQGRRANIKFRREMGSRAEFVHTLNGSGLAVPRVMIAIMETYQQEDGSFLVPKVLQPYAGFDRVTVAGR